MNNKLGLGISIDGTEKSNDHNRGYGSNLISKIRFISKKHSPSLDIGLICTIHPNELKNFFNNFKFFFDDLDVYSFVSGIAFHLANCDGWKAKHIKILKNEVKKIMGYYFKNKNRFKNIEITPISQITHGVKTYLSEQCFHLLTTNCNFKKLVVFPDGEINSCFIPRFMKDIKNNNSSLGNVSNFDTNIFLKKIKFLRTQFRIKDFIFDNYGKKSNNFLENLNKKYYSMSNKFCISFYGIENIELKTILEKTYFDTIKEESYRYEQNKQKWSLFKTL